MYRIFWKLKIKNSICCECKNSFVFCYREIFLVLRVCLLITVIMDHPVDISSSIPFLHIDTYDVKFTPRIDSIALLGYLHGMPIICYNTTVSTEKTICHFPPFYWLMIITD